MTDYMIMQYSTESSAKIALDRYLKSGYIKPEEKAYIQRFEGERIYWAIMSKHHD